MEKLLVRGSQRSEKEPLNSIDPDTFYIQWEMNTSWSMQFTAKNDHSVAYSMLDSEASLFYDGQEFVIKQTVPDFNEGVDAKNVVATHVYTELSRVRIYKDYVDENDPSHNNDANVKVAGSTDTDSGDQGTSTTTQNGNITTTVTRTDESEKENQIEYSIQEVMDKYLKDNKLGFTYEINGQFDKSRIAEITEGSGTDMLSTITEHWPNAVIFPDNKNIRVYDVQQFEQDHGNRLDYSYNTTEFKLSYDSTNLTNEVMCVGAKYQIETDTQTGGSAAGGGWGWPFPSVGEGSSTQAQRFGYDGGYRRNSFHDGVDFGSIDHPGSEVHAIHGGKVTLKSWGNGVNYYVVISSDDGYNVDYQEAFSSMSNITVNVGDVVKTGDVIGYRNTDHLHIGITKASLPGAFSHAFSDDGTWLDPVALIKGGSSDSGDDEMSETSSSAKFFYFKPFMATVDDSIKKYGEHPMEPIEDERFTDKNSMLQYALSKLQPEPALSVEVTTYTNFKPIPGDKVHVMVRDYELSTNLAVVGFTWYPESESNYTAVTLNTNSQNILDYQGSHQRMLEQSLENYNNNSSTIISGLGKNVWTQEEVNTFGNNLKLY